MGEGKELFVNDIPGDEAKQTYSQLPGCYFFMSGFGLAEQQQSVPSALVCIGFIDFMKSVP